MIQVVLLMAVIGLVVAHLWVKKVEGFQSKERYPHLQETEPPFGASEPEVSEAPAVETPAAYVPKVDDDPRDLPWIASWSPLDKEARRGHNCTPTYTEAGPSKTTLVTTSKSCESGLPHTRAGDRIVIPDNVSMPDREEVIRHELIHVYQARNPDLWRDFYSKQWAFELFTHPPKDMPASIVTAKRGNPDTFRTPWSCWKGRWWPAAIYNSTTNPTLRNATTVWWDSWKNEISKKAPTEWAAFFGPQSQDEHPHELAAVIITAEDTGYEAGRRLLAWWEATATRLYPPSIEGTA